MVKSGRWSRNGGCELLFGHGAVEDTLDGSPGVLDGTGLSASFMRLLMKFLAWYPGRLVWVTFLNAVLHGSGP